MHCRSIHFHHKHHHSIPFLPVHHGGLTSSFFVFRPRCSSPCIVAPFISIISITTPFRFFPCIFVPGVLLRCLQAREVDLVAILMSCKWGFTTHFHANGSCITWPQESGRRTTTMASCPSVHMLLNIHFTSNKETESKACSTRASQEECTPLSP